MSIVNEIKSQILSQLNHLTTNKINQDEENRVLTCMNNSLKSRVSTSLFIIGGEDRSFFIEKILGDHSILSKSQVARLNGRKCHNDIHAMSQIYESFLVNMSSYRNANTVLEDLEYFFVVSSLKIEFILYDIVHCIAGFYILYNELSNVNPKAILQ